MKALQGPGLEAAAHWRDLALSVGELSQPEMRAWGRALQRADAEIEGAYQLSVAAPPVLGSSAAYRQEELLASAYAQLGRDMKAWVARQNRMNAERTAALDRIEAELKALPEGPAREARRAELRRELEPLT